MPWVEGVAVCNSLGYHNASPASDIDLLIITRPGTIWLTRLVLAGGMALLGRRPTAEHSADTVCLSFFLSRNQLNLESLQKPGGDPYLVYWVNQLTPLVGRGTIWKEFWTANQWAKQYLPNALPYMNASPWVYQELPSRRGATGSIFEKMAERIQRWRLPESLRQLAASGGTDVVMNENVLKFHTHDRREEYRELWRASLVQQGL